MLHNVDAAFGTNLKKKLPSCNGRARNGQWSFTHKQCTEVGVGYSCQVKYHVNNTSFHKYSNLIDPLVVLFVLLGLSFTATVHLHWVTKNHKLSQHSVMTPHWQLDWLMHWYPHWQVDWLKGCGLKLSVPVIPCFCSHEECVKSCCPRNPTFGGEDDTGLQQQGQGDG